MAISSYKVFLMKGTGTDTITYTKYVDIKDYPSLGGTPERLDTTTLSDKMKTYIAGIQDTEELKFTANYDHTTFTTIKADELQDMHWAVWFGGTESNGVLTPTGSDGKFSFDGQLSVMVDGGGVNEVVDMIITITPSTIITAE